MVGGWNATYAAKAHDGKWHHAAVTYDAATKKVTLFYDYNQVSSITRTSVLAYTGSG